MRVITSIVVEYSMSSTMASTVSRIVFLSSSTFFSSSGEPRYTRDFTQVAQIVGPSLANCGNRWQMVGWHANNEPTHAQQLYNTAGPKENNLVGPLLDGSWLV